MTAKHHVNVNHARSTAHKMACEGESSWSGDPVSVHSSVSTQHDWRLDMRDYTPPRLRGIGVQPVSQMVREARHLPAHAEQELGDELRRVSHFSGVTVSARRKLSNSSIFPLRSTQYLPSGLWM